MIEDSPSQPEPQQPSAAAIPKHAAGGDDSRRHRPAATHGLAQWDPATFDKRQDEAIAEFWPRGAGRLPRREPGAELPDRPDPVPGLGAPVAEAAVEIAEPTVETAVDEVHRGPRGVRSNPRKAASFFQARSHQEEAATPEDTGADPESEQ
ncbi:hypothetical protein [Nocardia crassostreae]|uniref:hypothetical protein n=1 Tax=Nocardia crassostreae TaxID=53428 RepID=UPI000832C2F7|nr:hypothetical protein [Nocardia crassostreae]